MSFDLFSQPITMDEARGLRDAAMQRVERNAGEDFGQKARAYVLQYLRAHGPTSGEDLTEACKRAGIQAHDPRAMGPVIMKLIRLDAIERVGECRRRLGHGSHGGSVYAIKTYGNG